MSGNRVNEVGTMKPIAANGNFVVGPGSIIVGFACSTAGSIAIADSTGTLLNATALVAGQFLPIPAECPLAATVTLSGGCVGTLFVA